MKVLYLKNLLLITIAFAITYSIGNVVFCLFNQDNTKPVRNAFIKNFLGLCTIIFFYSIFKTSFFTINLGFVIILIFAIIRYKPIFKMNFKINFRILLFQLFILLVIYSVFYVRYYNPITGTYHSFFCDFPTYSCFVENMNKNGLESIFYDYLNYPPVRGIYHYGDLWIAAFFSFIFKQTALSAFYFIMFPLLSTIFCIGLVALLSPTKISYKLLLLVVIFIFISTISIYFPKSISFFNTDWAEYTMFNSPKRTIVGIVFLMTIILATEKKYYLVVLTLLTMVCIYTISSPVIYVFSAMYIAYLFFTNKIDYKNALLFAMPMFAMAIFVAIFMKIIGDINSKYLPSNYPSLLDIPHISITQYVSTAFNKFVGLNIKLILGTLPFFILFILNKNKDRLILKKIVLTIGIIISGFFVSSVLFIAPESNQFYTITYIPAIAILIILLLFPIYESRNIFLKIVAAILIIICFYQNFFYSDFKLIESEMDKDFFTEVEQNIPSNTNYRFAVLNDSMIQDKDITNFNFYFPYHYFKLYFHNYNPLSLSVGNININNFNTDEYIYKSQLMFIQNSPFYKYLEEQRKIKGTIIYNQEMLNFILKYKIKYIVLHPDTKIPDILKQRVVKVIESKRDKYKLCILDN